MAEQILQLNFRYCGPGNTYQQVVTILAQVASNAPGLIWKTWLINEREAEAGGLYLFRDEASLRHYLEGTLWKTLCQHEAVCDVSTKCFATLNEIPLIALKRWSERPPL
jgi:hypothetical protein